MTETGCTSNSGLATSPALGYGRFLAGCYYYAYAKASGKLLHAGRPLG